MPAAPEPAALKPTTLKPIWIGRFHVSGPRENPHLNGHSAASLWIASDSASAAELRARVDSALREQGLTITASDAVQQVLDDAAPSPEVRTLLWDARRNPGLVFCGKFEALEDHFSLGPMLLQVKTERLLLRPWQQRDREPFAALNADREVMAFELAPLTRHRSNEAIDQSLANLQKFGFDLLAAETRVDGRPTGIFAGMMGVRLMPLVLPRLAQPALEIVFRLNRQHQRQGLATEGGRALLKLACEQLHFAEVVGVTAAANLPGRRLMEKLGMHYRPDLDCTDPAFPSRHLFRQRAVYLYRHPTV